MLVANVELSAGLGCLDHELLGHELRRSDAGVARRGRQTRIVIADNRSRMDDHSIDAADAVANRTPMV
jgi:hypothetical protein